jgi:hypothetical protein
VEGFGRRKLPTKMKLLIFLSLISATIAASLPDFGEENNEEFPDVIFSL